jgi:hypothetical protein
MACQIFTDLPGRSLTPGQSAGGTTATSGAARLTSYKEIIMRQHHSTFHPLRKPARRGGFAAVVIARRPGVRKEHAVMNHHPAPSSQRHCDARRTPLTCRTLARLSGLAVLLTAAISLAPAALASPPPPEPSVAPVPPPPPPAVAPAQLPLWAIAVFVAATVILSVATTLTTLAVDRTRRTRDEAMAVPEPQPSARTPFTSPARYNGDVEIIDSHRRRRGGAAGEATEDHSPA